MTIGTATVVPTASRTASIHPALANGLSG
jgi:hypothetical protein